MYNLFEAKDDDGKIISISSNGYIRISSDEWRRIVDVYGPIKVCDKKYQIRIGYFDFESKDNVKDVFVSFEFQDFAKQFITYIVGRE